MRAADAIAKAGAGDFAHDTERFRRELLAHCYRMLGSVNDAEDVVQETYLRAWRSYHTFEGRSSLRVWLYRIATNACLDAIGQRGRRALRSTPSAARDPADPPGPGAPTDPPDPGAPTDPSASGASADPPGPGDPAGPFVAGPFVAWLEPFPDAMVATESADPAAIVTAREDLRLALVASLQYLSPRQRAVLILREVLGFRAAEVASMLDTTVAAIKSTLQRARARLGEVDPRRRHADEPTDAKARELLGLYLAGFENADLAALEKALRTDAAIDLVGGHAWFSGRAACLRFLADVIGEPGDWRMIPTAANGQPAAAAYRRDGGVYRAFGLGVLTVAETGITRITVFGGGPDLVARWGLPAELRPRPADS